MRADAVDHGGTSEVLPPPGHGLAVALRGWARLAVGVLLGGLTAVADLVYLAGAGLLLVPAALWPPARSAVTRPAFAGARKLAGLERRRLAHFLGYEDAAAYSGRRALGYLALRWPVGLLGGSVLFLLAFGVWAAAAMVWGALGDGTLWPLPSVESSDGATTASLAAVAIPGLVLLFLNLQGIAGVAALERRLARRFLGPSGRELLERRVTELATTRAEVVEAVNDERRRIERDIHDGVQQRLVALGMLLGQARRSQHADTAAELLRQAHEESQQALQDLRDVAWRVYPTALDGDGLNAALEMVAERCSLPVRIQYDLAARPATHVETVAYFVACEGVTNAAKHAGAGQVTVHVTRGTDMVVVDVRDDGHGGADPGGNGLSGLARRVAALDGHFRVDSPPGGPTLITAELPCA